MFLRLRLDTLNNVLRSIEETEMYEPSTIQCRVLLDCKEKIILMQRDLCSLGTEASSICEKLSDIFQELEAMHENHRLELKNK